MQSLLIWQNPQAYSSFPTPCLKKPNIIRSSEARSFTLPWFHGTNLTMEPAPIKAYYSSQEEFKTFHSSLKQLLCPHCRKRGHLILHGFLYGYGDTDWVKRGHRIFCSNRNQRSGCGRTFSLLKTWFIKHLMISTRVMSAFLDNLCQGQCTAKAGRLPDNQMSKTSIYRIYHRFKHSQSRIRTLLKQVKDPPKLPGTKDPVIQTVLHLKSVFKGYFVSKYQRFFQVSLL